jgi:Trk K+ transport system NAD-binding subunit
MLKNSKQNDKMKSKELHRKKMNRLLADFLVKNGYNVTAVLDSHENRKIVNFLVVSFDTLPESALTRLGLADLIID